MPKVVANRIYYHKVENISLIQDEIIENYRGDFSKHTDNTTAIRIGQIFDTLVNQFAKENDKFLYGTIRS
jgi:hypothetical protein